ncbi:hypothetical protein DPMN_014642 [Dreissena polymorpha]|uniref:Uncharacterized protein n=1 Tax=Dreissena polymorpha TaxID=45954 RepID=A0A9D4N6E0_DREPO|nr:hypothetical protein DPMN_014642 [Dreissena polymorpha]
MIASGVLIWGVCFPRLSKEANVPEESDFSKEANVPEESDFSAVSIILPPIANVFWKKALQTHFVSK